MVQHGQVVGVQGPYIALVAVNIDGAAGIVCAEVCKAGQLGKPQIFAVALYMLDLRNAISAQPARVQCRYTGIELIAVEAKLGDPAPFGVWLPRGGIR